MHVRLGWLVLVLVLSVGLAQQRTLTVSGFGLNQNLIDKNITRPFEARCNCKIVWEVGNNADRLAKLVARKDNPNVDVALLGDYFAQLAANQGLLERLDTSKLSNLNELYDFAKNPLGGNFAVAFTTYAISIAYRSDKITTPITSWRDLWRPELKGRIALPNITTTQGPPVVWLINRAFGGTDANTNPGFERLSALKANVVTYYNQSAQLAGLFAQEEVWAAPVGRFAWGNLLATGKPLAWARLSEGQAGVSNVAVLVKGNRNQELAYQFIDFIISREVQTAQANDLVDSPVNRSVRVATDKAAQLTYGLQQIASLRTVDPDYIVKVRDAWIQRWNREVAR